MAHLNIYRFAQRLAFNTLTLSAVEIKMDETKFGTVLH